MISSSQTAFKGWITRIDPTLNPLIGGDDPKLTLTRYRSGRSGSGKIPEHIPPRNSELFHRTGGLGPGSRGTIESIESMVEFLQDSTVFVAFRSIKAWHSRPVNSWLPLHPPDRFCGWLAILLAMDGKTNLVVSSFRQLFLKRLSRSFPRKSALLNWQSSNGSALGLSYAG